MGFLLFYFLRFPKKCRNLCLHRLRNDYTNTKFIEKNGLPFSFLIDDQHQVSESYVVWVLKKMYGKEYMGVERSTFLIDPTGTVIKEWRKVKVKGHVEEALQTLRGIIEE
jgi:peroxiredoxin Q/BCP